jgi:hypothetical protein
VGGGIAHGPKPRDYTFSLTKKTRALALKGALSDRAREGSIVVVDLPAFEEPRTKRAVELLDKWGASGKVLVVTGQRDPTEHIDTWKSFRNLPNVLMVQVPTTYRVLAADVVVLTREALAEITKSEVAVETAAAAAPETAEAVATVSEIAPEAVPAPEAVLENDSDGSDEGVESPAESEAPLKAPDQVEAGEAE